MERTSDLLPGEIPRTAPHLVLDTKIACRVSTRQYQVLQCVVGTLTAGAAYILRLATAQADESSVSTPFGPLNMVCVHMFGVDVLPGRLGCQHYTFELHPSWEDRMGRSGRSPIRARVVP